MKQIELELKKRLLIVEYADKREAELDLLTHKAIPESDKTVICLGSELTEEIAEDLVKIDDEGICCWDYKTNKWNDGNPPIESFISAIEAQGYYWGENPVKHPEDFDNLPSSLSVYCNQEDKHFEAESKTFNPEKTLIFEILL